MSVHNHFRHVCKHGNVVGQCRCNATDKVEVLVDCWCDEIRAISLDERKDKQ